jgi:rhamnosyl/mannosyltransferase
MAHVATVLLPPSVRRVITWHSDIVRQKGLLALYRPFLDRLVRSADAIILPTPAHGTASRQLGAVENEAKLAVVPFGFDFSHLQRPRRVLPRRQGRLLVFALGRHVYYKGFEFLIRALPEAPDADLILGGRGPLMEHLVQLAREMGVSNRVEFAGRIPEEDLPAYYHACDVFCMPSVERSEAFGIVQVEAMACGRPVVCCELHNGVTWVNRHGETGLVVPPADPAALAAALQLLHRDPELRARLGEQARRRAHEVFSLEQMRSGTLEVYRRALAIPAR